LTPIGGSLGQVFGICANEFGAADGQLVATTFGCGAHSSVRPDVKAPVPVVPLVIDDDKDERSDASDVGEYEPLPTTDEASDVTEGQDVLAGEVLTEVSAYETGASESGEGAESVSGDELEASGDVADDQPDLVEESEFVEFATETVDSVANEAEPDVDFVSEFDESASAQDPVED
jgi:hypothetical protein